MSPWFPRPPRADGVSVPPENGELHEEDHVFSALGVGDRVQAALWAPSGTGPSWRVPLADEGSTGPPCPGDGWPGQGGRGFGPDRLGRGGRPGRELAACQGPRPPPAGAVTSHLAIRGSAAAQGERGGAEGAGFEPAGPTRGPAAFKAAAIVRSAIPPPARLPVTPLPPWRTRACSVRRRPSAIGNGERLEPVARGLAEVHAPAAVAVVDLTRVFAVRIGPVR
jgi:hypothetical protein